MEQHRTRPRQYRPPRGRPPLPAQAQRRPAAVRRPAPPPAPARPTVRRLPNPRLTGLGGGLFCGAVMVVLGWLDQVLFGASLTVYGVLFLPVCALTACWIRRGDLVTAPVVVPIAFAVGLLPLADEGGGFLGSLMGLFTALATQAGWLYGGTLVAGVIATVRKIRLMSRRAAQQRSRV
ncbi:hypothetical protein F7R91_11460 [Streptomyces luteolifulvus]|uniref:DUF6542 domain-containing protein n=1 Tax=Streptomyces luteolifulvus TaxID=2615112 RepID=A0A6H9V3P0_9ACTN|nr:DUF6542 domain-containing protein [Streptomyces luteolifulvus]KAB1147701.1 hypothetical protein F7R91_11460 [Streptomyces luteolifulvus]